MDLECWACGQQFALGALGHWPAMGPWPKIDLNFPFKPWFFRTCCLWGHQKYRKPLDLALMVEKLLSIAPALIFDTIGLFDESQLLILQSKHGVSVLGRGDL